MLENISTMLGNIVNALGGLMTTMGIVFDGQFACPMKKAFLMSPFIWAKKNKKNKMSTRQTW